MTTEHSPDDQYKYIEALQITLQGGPGHGHMFYAYPGKTTSIIAVGFTLDKSTHLYAYDAQTNKTTYLGPQHNQGLAHPVVAWIDPPQRETY